MAMTALRCTPPLPSRTVPARMVMGCWAAAIVVMPTSVPAAIAAMANRVYMGSLLGECQSFGSTAPHILCILSGRTMSSNARPVKSGNDECKRALHCNRHKSYFGNNRRGFPMLDLTEKKRAATAMAAGPPADFQKHLAALEAQGLVTRIDRPINKDTELHPLVRWQFQGGLAEDQRRAFLFTNVVDSAGRKYDMPVAVGALGASARIYSVGMGRPVEEIENAWTAG